MELIEVAEDDRDALGLEVSDAVYRLDDSAWYEQE